MDVCCRGIHIHEQTCSSVKAIGGQPHLGNARDLLDLYFKAHQGATARADGDHHLKSRLRLLVPQTISRRGCDRDQQEEREYHIARYRMRRERIPPSRCGNISLTLSRRVSVWWHHKGIGSTWRRPIVLRCLLLSRVRFPPVGALAIHSWTEPKQSVVTREEDIS